MQNCEQIEIEEGNEPLVSIVGVHPKIEVQPQYYLNGIKDAGEGVLVRETLKNKLMNIANKIPNGYKILVWDTYCTLETQINLFSKNYVQDTKKMSEGELIKYKSQFVSLPSFDVTKPSPHNTGASIDLTICDEDKNPINLGIYFDEFCEKSYANYYEKF